MDDVKLWDDVSSKYEEHSYKEEKKYRANRFRTEMILGYLDKLMSKGKKVLDAGCGTGIVTRKLVKEGWDCIGVDFSEEMLKEARKKAEAKGLSIDFKKVSVLDMSLFPDKSFDIIMLNGVLPYINEEDEEEAYKECYRLLKKGGILIVSQYNSLFDLFALNKYTLETYGEVLKDVVDDEEIEKYKDKIKGLLKNPDKPEDERTMKTENPLTYGDKLNEYGFKEEDRCYYNFHILPPELTDESQNAIRATLENEFRGSWQGIILARGFMSIARKK